jgi:hypothetical protein
MLIILVRLDATTMLAVLTPLAAVAVGIRQEPAGAELASRVTRGVRRLLGVRCCWTPDVHDAAVHQIIVVVDVEGFAARNRILGDQVTIRAGLYRALQLAFTRLGVSWDACHHEDRGDGVLILVPGQVRKAVLAAGVPGALAAAVRAHNQVHGPGARMRLRLALHAGEVAYDAHGVTGTAVTLAFRLLEAEQVKQALAGSQGMLAVITSAWFYEEVIRQNEACAAATWRRVHVKVKETRQEGWISLPDALGQELAEREAELAAFITDRNLRWCRR